MNRPKSLDDLPFFRQVLLNEPQGSVSRKFGERLQSLQNLRGSGQIAHETFVTRAMEIADELMAHRDDLINSHWKVANEDVYLQYREFSAQAAAVGHPVREDGRASESSLAHIEDLMPLDNVRITSLLSAEAVPGLFLAAQQHGINHPQDLAALRRRAESFRR